MILSFIERVKEDPNLIKNLSVGDRRLFVINNLNNPEFEEDGLLNTIKVPLDMTSIGHTLPKPNYREEQGLNFANSYQDVSPRLAQASSVNEKH